MGPSDDLFADSDEGGESLDNTNESAAMAWIMAFPEIASLLLGHCDFTGEIAYECDATKPFLPRAKGGDLDLVVAPVADPRKTVAFQAKRFKAKRGETGDAVHLDQEKLAKLARQCNETAALGFYKTYGLVLVMIDGSTNPAASVLHRGVSGQTFRRVYCAVQSHSFDERIGIVFVEIAQPTSAAVGEFGFIAVGVDRPAKPTEQVGEFSTRAAKWIGRRQRGSFVRNIDLPPISAPFAMVRPEDRIRLQITERKRTP